MFNSLKQIPFTVPTSPHGPGCRTGLKKGEHHSLDDSSASGRSEPTSPTGKRPSVEIPGAYALGSIDPALYKVADEDDHYDIPPDHIGRIWFATEYDRETEKLMVTVIKARNLPSRTQGLDNACDPFVRLYLMPDERRYLQSKMRKKTCHPKFEETYVFQVSHRALEERVLKLTVLDVDRHKRHQVIGHALYPLREHDCENNVRLVIWRDLEREVSECTANKGEILVSLCYNNHLERLTIGLFETRDMCTTPPTAPGIDAYVKITLMIQNKPVKVKKTELAKKTTNPNFNESFTFKVANSSLDSASINLSVMQHNTGLKDKQLGRIVLGSFMFARNKELDHWNEMLANQREQILHWHTLT
ncbi:synaptotagmin-15-like isoform X3 [Biomphalaria glabrata]|uniref:Synaptotagmin-15-like isoform X3 n=1 Tax=Biomphalaria glabrata TaxID=6526 RepID=A0A9W2ZJQ0_BIOGL|nr:synaptotagmin-15-like isoform X3 [Biomphalaria glabrata]